MFLGMAYIRHVPPWYAPWAFEPELYFAVGLLSLFALAFIVTCRSALHALPRPMLTASVVIVALLSLLINGIFLFVPY